MPIGFHFDDIEEAYFANEYAQPRHGKWIIENDSIRCSVCGYKTAPYIPYIDNGEKFVPLYATKYCGNCGAKMESNKNV